MGSGIKCGVAPTSLKAPLAGIFSAAATSNFGRCTTFTVQEPERPMRLFNKLHDALLVAVVIVLDPYPEPVASERKAQPSALPDRHHLAPTLAARRCAPQSHE